MNKNLIKPVFSVLIAALVIVSCTDTVKPVASNKSTVEKPLPIINTSNSSSPINDNKATTVSNNTNQGYITQGLAKTEVKNLLPCQGSRISGLGSIMSNNKSLIVPAEVNYKTATKAPDLYNDCTEVRPKDISQVNLASIPVIEVDKDGEEITGFIFADNYFELYVNGKLITVDAVPFTPFNSSVVKFKAKKPITYAIKLVDWEENLGQGTENNQGNPYHAGDGGFIAKFSDGTVTNSKWKAQSFYIAPLQDPSCVKDSSDGKHDSSSCITNVSCGTNCQAIHYSIPDNWFLPSFDASKWSEANVYTENEIGVDNKPAYMNFKPQFSGADFIWSSNLILDNELLVRYTTSEK